MLESNFRKILYYYNIINKTKHSGPKFLEAVKKNNVLFYAEKKNHFVTVNGIKMYRVVPVDVELL